jgi:hypothetical protein
MNMFPFFLECSKHYQNEPHKHKFLQRLAFGHGILIIKRKDKNILVTGNGEFIIPTIYSENAHKDLEKKLWVKNEFTKLADCLEETRRTWTTVRKKDKVFLLFKYVAALPDLTKLEKILLCNMVLLALFLKMIKPTDVEFRDSKIVSINQDLTKKETFTQMNFRCDYSTHNKPLRQQQTDCDEDENE